MNTPQSKLHGVSQLSQPEQETWRAFLSVTTRGLERIDQLLQKHSNITLTDYEILLALSTAENSRLRMSELAEQVLVSRSRLTYRVDRLVEVGFVTRQECEDDRRGLWAILTEHGQGTLNSATNGHHADVRRLFFDAINGDELATLDSILQQISSKLNAE